MRNNYMLGGCASEIRLGNYKFDMGPTFFNMLYIAEEIFELTGRNLHDYVELYDLDPMYELIFRDKKIKMTRNRAEMVRQVNELFPGNDGEYEKYIEEERMITPKDWENDISVYKGATFNLGHQLTQMLSFRPRNKFEELGQCWLVGGGTHPGSGLPIILESARITANSILAQDNKALFPVKPLPEVNGYQRIGKAPKPIVQM